MLSHTKLAIVSLVVIAIGAFQYAMPAFTNQQTSSTFSPPIQTDQTQRISSLGNQAINDFADGQGGALYFVTANAETGDKNQQRFLSPLLKSKVKIQVTGNIARTKLTQTFSNASNQWVNGLYVFPLPENAAVDHLLMKVGERKIEGLIKPNNEAKKIYLKAQSQGKKASLVAQLRPNIFSNAIANIGPNESIEISIEYQQTLNFDQQQYRLRFPMAITPRYHPNNAQQAQLHQATELPLDQSNQQIELEVDLHAGFELDKLASEFHAIIVKAKADGGQHIQLSDIRNPTQDFVLSWRPKLATAPQSAHFTQRVNGDEYGLIMLIPPVINPTSNQALPKEMIFVLDTSGSMEGDPIKQAKQALRIAIDQLEPQDHFNIIEFNSYAQDLWPSSQPASLKNQQQAKQFVDQLTANGGTEMLAALNLAFAKDKTDQSVTLQQIVFITDGSVSNEESLMQLIQSKLDNSRLFTVGIGSAPNSYFMSEAAKMGRGTFTYIGSVNQVQEKMLNLFKKIKHPALTDIELKLGADALQSNLNLEFYPNVISDLYKGEPLVLSYKLNADKNASDNPEQVLSKLSLSALYQGKPWQNSLPLNAKSRQSGLNVLWAREKITQLTRDKRSASLHPNNSAAKQRLFKTQITETAMQHHLVSQYTSLVAVDVTPSRPEKTQSKNTQMANLIQQNTGSRANNLSGQLPQTATSAQLRIIAGLFLIGIAVCMHLLTKIRVRLLGTFS